MASITHEMWRDNLRAVLADLRGYAHDDAALHNRAVRKHGAVFTVRSSGQGGPITYVDMAGLTATAYMGEVHAVRNWMARAENLTQD